MFRLPACNSSQLDSTQLNSTRSRTHLTLKPDSIQLGSVHTEPTLFGSIRLACSLTKSAIEHFNSINSSRIFLKRGIPQKCKSARDICPACVMRHLEFDVMILSSPEVKSNSQRGNVESRVVNLYVFAARFHSNFAFLKLSFHGRKRKI